MSQITQRFVTPFKWLFVRLPKPFTLPLLVIAFLYFFLLFPSAVNLSNLGIFWIQDHVTRGEHVSHTDTSTFIWHYLPNISQSGLSWNTFFTLVVIVVSLIASAVMTILLALFGLWLSYWVAGKFYEFYRRRRVKHL